MYEGGKSYWMVEEEEEEQVQMMMPSPSVDCTLSLGTPSTRVYNHHQHQHQRLRSFSSRPPKADPRPLLPRRCANCDTTSTPLWRNGPRGPKSLCNACGIRFKKEERRASAAAAQPTTPPCYSSPYQEFRFITFVD